MKKETKYNIAFVILTVLYLLTPLVTIIGYIKGYNCYMSGKTAYIVVVMMLTVLLLCSVFVFKPKFNKISILLTATLFISAFINLFTFREHITLACIAVIATIVMFAVSLPKTVAVIMSVVMGCLLAMVIFFISALGLFPSLSENRVYKEVNSPNGKYTAQIIINDQGAFGGNTGVMLKNNEDKKRVLFYKLEKKDVKLYTGKYTEYTDITLEWQDEFILLINDNEYIIEKNNIE